MSAARSVRLTAWVILLSAPTLAFAHGRIPAVYGVVADGDGELEAIVTTLGPVRQLDGEWRWACRASLAISPTEDPVFANRATGGLLASTFRGVLALDSNLCGVRPVEPLTNVFIDLQVDPSAPATIYALESSGSGSDNRLFRSTDAGETFAETSPAIESILFERVRIAPSDPQRIYLSGAYPRTAEQPARRIFVHRSDDGGATWSRTPFEYREGERNLLLLAVHPVDVDTVYARVVRERDHPELPERLIRSVDGGETWSTLMEVESAIGDLAFLGSTAYLGVPASNVEPVPPSGIWRSDDGAVFRQVRSDLDVRCLQPADRGLYVCGSEVRDGYSLGRMIDDDSAIEPLFALSELEGPAICDAERAETCALDDTDVYCDLRLDSAEGRMCVGFPDAGVPDAGVGDASLDAGPPIADPGCGCRAAGGPGRSVVSVLAVLAIAAWRRRPRH